MIKKLTFCILMGSACATACLARVNEARNPINFEIDGRGFKNCYGSFVAKVKPGVEIPDDAFDIINRALEQKGNVMERIAATENLAAVQNQRNCRAFMDNIQGRKRARPHVIGDSFFSAPVQELPQKPLAAEVNSKKRKWVQRREALPLTPQTQDLIRQAARDIIEDKYRPTPMNVERLPVLNIFDSVKKYMLATPPGLQKPVPQPILVEKPAAKRQKGNEGRSFVKNRIAFWEGLSANNK